DRDKNMQPQDSRASQRSFAKLRHAFELNQCEPRHANQDAGDEENDTELDGALVGTVASAGQMSEAKKKKRNNDYDTEQNMKEGQAEREISRQVLTRKHAHNAKRQ